MIERATLSTTSEETTDGIRVRVTSQYLENQSSPMSRRYVFAYTVEITNVGDTTAQLVTRHWIIENAEGRVEEVKGPGVVGNTPNLAPGERFEYTSGAVLTTPRGSMRGTYQMVRPDDSQFDAVVARFALEQPYSLN